MEKILLLKIKAISVEAESNLRRIKVSRTVQIVNFKFIELKLNWFAIKEKIDDVECRFLPTPKENVFIKRLHMFIHTFYVSWCAQFHFNYDIFLRPARPLAIWKLNSK